MRHLFKHTFTAIRFDEISFSETNHDDINLYITQFNAFQLRTSTIEGLVELLLNLKRLKDQKFITPAIYIGMQMMEDYLEAVSRLQTCEKTNNKVIDQETIGKFRLIVEQTTLSAITVPKFKNEAFYQLKLKLISLCYQLSRTVKKIYSPQELIEIILDTRTALPVELASDFLRETTQLKSKKCSNIEEFYELFFNEIIKQSSALIHNEIELASVLFEQGLPESKSINLRRLIPMIIRMKDHLPAHLFARLTSEFTKLSFKAIDILNEVSRSDRWRSHLSAYGNSLEFDLWFTSSFTSNIMFRVIMYSQYDRHSDNKEDVRSLVSSLVLALKDCPLNFTPTSSEPAKVQKEIPSRFESQEVVLAIDEDMPLEGRVVRKEVFLVGCKSVKIKAFDIDHRTDTVAVFVSIQQDRVRSEPGEPTTEEITVPYALLKPFESLEVKCNRVVIVIRSQPIESGKTDSKIEKKKETRRIRVVVKGYEKIFTENNALRHLGDLFEQNYVEELRSKYLEERGPESALSNLMTVQSEKCLNQVYSSVLFRNGFSVDKFNDCYQKIHIAISEETDISITREKICETIYADVIKIIKIQDDTIVKNINIFFDNLQRSTRSIYSELLGISGYLLVKSLFLLMVYHNNQLSEISNTVNASREESQQYEDMWRACTKIRSIARGFERIEQFGELHKKIVFLLSLDPSTSHIRDVKESVHSSQTKRPYHGKKLVEVVRMQLDMIKLKRGSKTRVSKVISTKIEGSIIRFISLDTSTSSIVSHLSIKQRRFKAFFNLIKTLESISRDRSGDIKLTLSVVNQILRNNSDTLTYLTEDFEGISQDDLSHLSSTLSIVFRHIVDYLCRESHKDNERILSGIEALKWLWRPFLSKCAALIDLRAIWESNHKSNLPSITKLRQSIIELGGIILRVSLPDTSSQDDSQKGDSIENELAETLTKNLSFLFHLLEERMKVVENSKRTEYPSIQDLLSYTAHNTDSTSIWRLRKASQIPLTIDKDNITTSMFKYEQSEDDKIINIWRNIELSSLEGSPLKADYAEICNILCHFYFHAYSCPKTASKFFENIENTNRIVRIAISSSYPSYISLIAINILKLCLNERIARESITQQLYKQVDIIIIKVLQLYTNIYTDPVHRKLIDAQHSIALMGLMRSMIANDMIKDCLLPRIKELMRPGVTNGSKLCGLHMLDVWKEYLSIGSVVYIKTDSTKSPLLMLGSSSGLHAQAIARDWLHLERNLEVERDRRNDGGLGEGDKDSVVVCMRTRNYYLVKNSDVELVERSDEDTQEKLIVVKDYIIDLGLESVDIDLLDSVEKYSMLRVLASTYDKRFSSVIQRLVDGFTRSDLLDTFTSNDIYRAVDSNLILLATQSDRSLGEYIKVHVPQSENPSHRSLREKLMNNLAKKYIINRENSPKKSLGFKDLILSSFKPRQRMGYETTENLLSLSNLQLLLTSAARSITLKYMSSIDLRDDIEATSHLLKQISIRYLQLTSINEMYSEASDMQSTLLSIIEEAPDLLLLFESIMRESNPQSFELTTTMINNMLEISRQRKEYGLKNDYRMILETFTKYLVINIGIILNDEKSIIRYDTSVLYGVVISIETFLYHVTLLSSDDNSPPLERRISDDMVIGFGRILDTIDKISTEGYITTDDSLSNILILFSLEVQGLYRFTSNDLPMNSQQISYLDYTLETLRTVRDSPTACDDLLIKSIILHRLRTDKSLVNHYSVETNGNKTQIDLSSYTNWMVIHKDDANNSHFQIRDEVRKEILCNDRIGCKDVYRFTPSASPNYIISSEKISNYIARGVGSEKYNHFFHFMQTLLRGDKSDRFQILSKSLILVNSILIHADTCVVIDTSISIAYSNDDVIIYYKPGSKELRIIELNNPSNLPVESPLISLKRKGIYYKDLSYLPDIISINHHRSHDIIVLVLSTGKLHTFDLERLKGKPEKKPIDPSPMTIHNIYSKLNSTDYRSEERIKGPNGKEVNKVLYTPYNIVDYHNFGDVDIFIMQQKNGVIVQVVKCDRYEENGENLSEGILIEGETVIKQVVSLQIVFLLMRSGKLYCVSEDVSDSDKPEGFKQLESSNIMVLEDKKILDICELHTPESPPNFVLAIEETEVKEGEVSSKVQKLKVIKPSDRSLYHLKDEMNLKEDTVLSSGGFGVDYVLLNFTHIDENDNNAIIDNEGHITIAPVDESEYFSDFPVAVFLSDDKQRLETRLAVGYNDLNPPKFLDQSAAMVVIGVPPINGLNRPKMLRALKAYEDTEFEGPEPTTEPYHICFDDLNFFSTDSAPIDPDQLPGLTFIIKVFRKQRVGITTLKEILTSFPTEEEQEQELMLEETKRRDAEEKKKAEEAEKAAEKLLGNIPTANFSPDFLRMSRTEFEKFKEETRGWWQEILEKYKGDIKENFQCIMNAKVGSIGVFIEKNDVSGVPELADLIPKKDEEKLSFKIAYEAVRMCHIFYLDILRITPHTNSIIMRRTLDDVFEGKRADSIFDVSHLKDRNTRLHIRVNKMKGSNITSLRRQNFSLLNQLCYAVEESLGDLNKSNTIEDIRFSFIGERKI